MNGWWFVFRRRLLEVVVLRRFAVENLRQLVLYDFVIGTGKAVCNVSRNQAPASTRLWVNPAFDSSVVESRWTKVRIEHV